MCAGIVSNTKFYLVTPSRRLRDFRQLFRFIEYYEDIFISLNIVGIPQAAKRYQDGGGAYWRSWKPEVSSGAGSRAAAELGKAAV